MAIPFRYVLRSITILAAASVIVGCNAGGDTMRRPNKIDSLATIDHRRLPLTDLPVAWVADSALFGRISDLKLTDSVLVVVDNAPLRGPVIVLNPASGTKVAVLGTSGQGPGEIVSARRIGVSPTRTGGAWIYDTELLRVVHFSPSVLAGAGNGLADSTISLANTDARQPSEIVMFNDSTFAVTSLFARVRISAINLHGKLLDQWGEIPGNPSETAVLRNQAYQGHIVLKPDGTHMALAVDNAGRVEIIDIKQRKTELADVPFDFDPIYVANSDGFASFSRMNRFGYVAVTASDRYIYAVFSGQIFGRNGAPSENDRYVHVFDWSGKFLRVLRLQTGTFRLDVDRHDRFLYVASVYPEYYTVTAYSLPDER